MNNKCANCKKPKSIKESYLCTFSRVHNEFEVLKTDILEGILRKKFEPQLFCAFDNDFYEMNEMEE